MMRASRGIVCEKHETYFVFLTSEGEFLRGTPIAGNPEVGEEVDFQLLQPIATHSQKKWKPLFLAPALIAAVFLVFVVASMIPESEKAFAYVQLEGVDSIELGVDEEGNVITLRSLDEASTEIETEWIGLPISVVLAQAVKEISSKEELVITTIYEKENKVELKNTIENAVTEVRQSNTEKPVQIKKSTKEERTKANKEKKSVQQYKQKDKQAVEAPSKQSKPPGEHKREKQSDKPAAEKQKEKQKQNSPHKEEKKKKHKEEKKHPDKKQSKGKPNGHKEHPSKGNKKENKHGKDPHKP